MFGKKKVKNLIILGVVCLFASVFVVKALTHTPATDLVNITSNVGGTVTLDKVETNVNPSDISIAPESSVEKTNYLARILIEPNPGYYAKSLSVKQDGNDIATGFIAGAETGAFFREYGLRANETIYEFFIPEETTTDKKVQVEVEFALKEKIDISYAKYTSNNYNEEELYKESNYDFEHQTVLVEDYMDGDLILPDDFLTNGGSLIFTFPEESYAFFKKDINGWAGYFDGEDVVMVGGMDEGACVDASHTCFMPITKDFVKSSQGRITFGYDDFRIYANNSIVFEGEGDVRNFNDSDMLVAFNPNGLTSRIDELFYGTHTLTLRKVTPKAIINDSQTNNCGTVKTFDNVTGSGYGYSTSYNNDVLTVTITQYYQDIMTLELTVTNNNANIFSDKINIELNRYAFNRYTTESDSMGRNCQETNNNNTCADEVYYSVQYRGVLSKFYVAEGATPIEIDTHHYVEGITSNSITLSEESNYPEHAYARDKSFTPHVLALFYNKAGMIVDTKVFDLNDEINNEGFLTKESFNSTFGSLTLNREVTANYVRFDNEHLIPMKYLDFFRDIDNAAIMHELVLIKKSEAQEKSINKIALFLVNGEIKEDDIPSLTYGTGEGRIIELRDNGGGE